MRISSRPRSRSSKDNVLTGRTTRSSSTPRSLRQSDLSIMRTQTSGLKRDIADLKRQTKELKKKSPVLARQARPETKKGGQRIVPMEENSRDAGICGNNSVLTSEATNDDVHGADKRGSIVSANDCNGGGFARKGDDATDAKVDTNQLDGSNVAPHESNDHELRDASFEGTNDDSLESNDAADGLKSRRRKRRRRFFPKKKPKLTLHSSGDAENVSSRGPKRGRRSLLGSCEDGAVSPSEEDQEASVKQDTARTTIIRELQTSKGFVDKVDLDELVPMRRTPRMASLNAIAKVNAVLESYGPKAANDLREKVHCKKSEYGLRSKEDKRRKRSASSVTQTDDVIFFTSIKGEHNEWMMSGSGDVFQQLVEQQPISDSRVSSTSAGTLEEESTAATKDKAVQTMINHKAVQTDLLFLDNASSPSSCTCGYIENVNWMEQMSPPQARDDAEWLVPCTVYRVPPTITANTLNVPVCSSISTKTTTHTIAIPFTKTHVLTHTDLKEMDENTNISTQGSKRMASLNAMAMMNAMKVLDRPFLSFAPGSTAVSSRGHHEYDRPDKGHFGQIRIPRINYQATSTSKFSMSGRSKPGSTVKSSQMKSLSNHLEDLLESKKQAFRPSSKVCCIFITSGRRFMFPFICNEAHKSEDSFDKNTQFPFFLFSTIFNLSV